MKDKPTVLIVDDSPINLILLSHLLEQQNFCVLSAGDGKKGWEIAKQSVPDIILLDVAMPGWDGYKTCQRIKNETTLESIPILFLSALDETENKVRALEVGAVDYISKPFQKDELLARVNTHLELAYLRQNLEQEVTHKTEKIQSLLEVVQLSYEKAQQISILQTEFLRNISHEFLTPLNVIKGMNEILIEDSILTEEQAYCTEAIQKSNQQLITLSTNALSFVDHFKDEDEQIMCDCHIKDCIKNLLSKFSESTQNMHLTTDINAQLPQEICINRNGLKKILQNILDNAIKFTPEDGTISIRVFQQEQLLCVEISDTGIGIEKEKQEELFTLFYQIDGSSTREYDGAGMGLAVAKMYTEKMGGTIGVNSIKGKGSTFWLKVPLHIKKESV
ncbi:MAG: hybrid sensor histidine kinase/response regulator [Thiomargarita sp.]|nr:hybrid sensor histidine kinase/response regulator [Thiomargarita sp.]